MEDQRRLQTRTNYSAHALVNSGTGATVKGVIRDISTVSIYLFIEPVFELNSPVMVEIIILGANSQLTVKMLARVVRKDQDGLAIQFFTPLEWWPIFTYFSSHNLNGVRFLQDNGTTLQPSSRREFAAFQGDLSVVTIENLMQLLGHATLSGELQLVTSVNSAIFFVHQGTLVYGYLEENPFRLGKRLVQENCITTADLQECLSLYQSESPKSKIGRLLVEKGYLQQADLEKVVKKQIKDIFFEVLSWQEGAFSFVVKEIPDNDGIFLEERIDHLILEGIIHLDTLS